MALEPENCTSHYHLGNAQCMIGEHCEAIESYKTALYHEGDVANSQLHFNLASAYSATRQYVLAADHYTRSI